MFRTSLILDLTAIQILLILSDLGSRRVQIIMSFKKLRSILHSLEFIHGTLLCGVQRLTFHEFYIIQSDISLVTGAPLCFKDDLKATKGQKLKLVPWKSYFVVKVEGEKLHERK